MPMNPLERHFRRNDKRLINKWMHYFDAYHRHFAAYRRRPITVLEFGVNQGGSLQMWRSYFGRRAQIVGVDIDPRCAALTGPNIEIHIGDQGDRAFLRSLAEKVGPIDIVVDDGGHEMHQQIATFEELWPAVRDGGVFLTEDTHTSYWERYGGGYQREGTFMEYVKDKIDQLNAWHSKEEGFEVDDYTRTIRSMHFYDSIVVFEKGTVVKPHHEKTGQQQFEYGPLQFNAVPGFKGFTRR